MKEIPEFLLELLKKQYSKEDLERILDGYQKERYTTFRINPILAQREEVLQVFQEDGYKLLEVSWYSLAFIILEEGRTPLSSLSVYQEGKIYVQSLSSMLPVFYLDPKEGEDILDMAASPGSKTTQIAAFSSNKAHITAVEKNPVRAERLQYNIQKQGVVCATLLQEDSRHLNSFFSFDKILLDAPCSGSGTFSYQEKYRLEKDYFMKLQKTQKDLLKKAFSLLKKGQILVYSTCSILEDENENVLLSLLENSSCSLVPITAFSGISTLPTKIPGCICVLPDAFMEGFFVAVLKKN